MFCKEFCHIGLGDTGEGIIRHALVNNLQRPLDGSPPRITVLNGDAHLKLLDAPSDAGPAFTFVRNPFDWYVSRWIHQLRNHRTQTGFADWYWENRRRGFTLKFVFDDQAEGIPVEKIGRFENLVEDFARILPLCWPEITGDEIRSWFPEAFRQWSNRPWIEGIEQYMRRDLYWSRSMILQAITRDDEWFFETFDYTFDQYYDFGENHT